MRRRVTTTNNLRQYRRTVSEFTALAVALFVCCLDASMSRAQHIPAEEAVIGARVTYAPNARYAAGGLHRLILGTDYRKTWTIPIELEVMDIHSYAGGLKPLKKGGFGQTTSLHMVDASGVRHVFRSIDKDPARGLPDDLRYTFVGNVVRDQISSQHPYASLIVPKLLEAVGTLHVTPHLYVMPNDPALGEFQSEFAGLIGAIEERPDDGPDGLPGFAGSTKVSSSSGMYEDLEKDARNQVDEISFLQARLMDIFLGDRDRHFDQWRWARMDGPGDRYRWLPIPKDRDQAFKVNDGLMMHFTRYYQRQYVSFSDEYPNIEGASYNGRELDRRLLVNLSRSTWDSVATDLQGRLTDSVIESAVRELPKEVYAYHGELLIRQLKSRRDDIVEMAHAYYKLLAKYVDLHSTDEPDIAEIDKNSDGSIRVKVMTKGGIPYFNRVFDPAETKEVRVLTHGGRDSIVVRGETPSSILLRILPGGNDDVVVDQSLGSKVLVYDDRGKNQVELGPHTKFDESEPHHRHPDELFLPPDPTDDESRAAQSWGQYWYPIFNASYSADFGFVVGGGGYVVKYGFRKQPYNYKWTIFAQGATEERGLLKSNLHFPGVGSKFTADIDGRLSSMELVTFYGFGNDFDVEEPTSDFFKVFHAEASLAAVLSYSLGSKTSLTFGPEIRVVNVDTDDNNIVSDSTLFGADDALTLPALKAGLTFDSRDNAGAAAKGVHVSLAGKVIPAVSGADSYFDAGAFAKMAGSVALYLSPDNPSANPMLALRVGGEKVFGDAPFYDAAFLGGSHNIRGYYQNRYAGDAVAFGNAELRLKLTHLNLIFPWEVGIHGLVDAGRVWLDNLDDDRLDKTSLDDVEEDKIHTAVGGGIWLSILRRTQTLSFTMAQGEDDALFYVKAGFHF